MSTGEDRQIGIFYLNILIITCFLIILLSEAGAMKRGIQLVRENYMAELDLSLMCVSRKLKCFF